MNINKNISVWNGSYPPPTNYHLWVRPDNTIFVNDGSKWVPASETLINTKLNKSEKGAANGVTPLDSSSKVPSQYLPSYVDDVLEYTNKSQFPAIGESGKIYVALDTNLTYRWSGSIYTEISKSLALGETSNTAFAGDRGVALENKYNELNTLNETVTDLNELVVKLHTTITQSVSPSTIYKGEATNVTINHSAKFDGEPLTYTLKVDNSELNNPYSVSDTKTFNLVFEINNEDPKLVTSISKTVKVNAYYPRYYGRVNKTILTSADVLALPKQPVSSSSAISNKTIASTVSDYLWLCVPDTMNINSVTSGGFAVPMESPITIAVTNKGNYKCYRSSNQINAGSLTFNVQ